MASVEVTISGVLYDKTARTTQPVVIIGEASLTGLGVGGGPIAPPPDPGKPPGIWGGGNVPMPTPPIANVPGAPGYQPPQPGQPPGIWGGSNEPFPTPPINLPPPGSKPPEPVNPPVSWKAVWHPTEGWIVVGVINPDVPHPVPSS